MLLPLKLSAVITLHPVTLCTAVYSSDHLHSLLMILSLSISILISIYFYFESTHTNTQTYNLTNLLILPLFHPLTQPLSEAEKIEMAIESLGAGTWGNLNIGEQKKVVEMEIWKSDVLSKWQVSSVWFSLLQYCIHPLRNSQIKNIFVILLTTLCNVHSSSYVSPYLRHFK